MRTVRIYEGDQELKEGLDITLSEDGSGHLCRVLRFNVGDKFTLFDGLNNEFNATLTATGKRACAHIEDRIERNTESPLYVELGQVISRGDKMDYTIQKAVELGISKIHPLISQRCGVKLDAKRQDKKVESWQKIVNSACEQSYRAYVPKVKPITTLEAFMQESDGFCNLTLDPKASIRFRDLDLKGKKIRLLIGPEGGLDDSEIEKAKEHGFIGVSLGPRILRTETAALVALSILGANFGDL